MIRFINLEENVVTDSNYEGFHDVNQSPIKVLVICGNLESHEHLETFYKRRLDLHKKDIEWSDKIILECRWEATHHDTWEKCIEYLKPKDVLTIDASLVPSSKYNNITVWKFFNHNNDVHPLPFNERNVLYQSLSRIASCKFQRIETTYRLYEKNILDKGIVTCMSGDGEINFDIEKRHSHISWDKNFTNLLPLLYDGPLNSHDASYKTIIGKNTKINVINESSFDITESTLFNGIKYNSGQFWTRPFVTEKTIKSFRLHQLPLFVAPKGFVNDLRDLGFDLYDDILNHDYDNESDPTRRIEMVVGELCRLSTIEDELLTKDGLWERMGNNVKRFDLLYEQNQIHVNDYIRKWSLSDSI